MAASQMSSNKIVLLAFESQMSIEYNIKIFEISLSRDKGKIKDVGLLLFFQEQFQRSNILGLLEWDSL